MSSGVSLGTSVVYTVVILLIEAVTYSQGGCQFKKSWSGRWFQSGVQQQLLINTSHIETKGECYQTEGEKYLVYDRSEDCYRCMVIHVIHSSVLQYKETYCEGKGSLSDICNAMTGDSPLFSMFRKYPEPKPITCPFKSAPFTFTYNRNLGDCNYPLSKAESCTDDSRLVLKYQACPDVPSAESNVEELVCLATWKEGSTRYLIGRVSQFGRRALTSDEDQYRCFIYQRSDHGKTIVYNIAQSGDATCNGLSSAFEGSRMIKLTTVDNHHNRCKFPSWITDHHTWLSLDHRKIYHFAQRNATLKILDDAELPFFKARPKPAATAPNPPGAGEQRFPFQEAGLESSDQRRPDEMRVICHMILQHSSKKAQIVAHVTTGCDSGYVCMLFHKRDTNVIELQQSEHFVESADDACASFNPVTSSYITLVTTTLHAQDCPHLGRYSVMFDTNEATRRKRESRPDKTIEVAQYPNCQNQNYQTLAVGCRTTTEMDFEPTCPQKGSNVMTTAYYCHGNWEENGVHYLITSPALPLVKKPSTGAPVGGPSEAARKLPDATPRYCLIYSLLSETAGDVTSDSSSSAVKTGARTFLRLSRVSDSCHRHVVPGLSGDLQLNFTSNGTCAKSGQSGQYLVIVPTFLLALPILILLILR